MRRSEVTMIHCQASEWSVNTRISFDGSSGSHHRRSDRLRHPPGAPADALDRGAAEAVAAGAPVIETVHGVGYKLRA